MLVELGVVIGKTGRDISEEDAYSHVAGYGTKLDSLVKCTSLNYLNLYSSCCWHDCTEYARTSETQRPSLERCEGIWYLHSYQVSRNLSTCATFPSTIFFSIVLMYLGHLWANLKILALFSRWVNCEIMHKYMTTFIRSMALLNKMGTPVIWSSLYPAWLTTYPPLWH